MLNNSKCIATKILEVRSYRGMECSCSLDSELELPNRVGLLRFYPVVLRWRDGSCRRAPVMHWISPEYADIDFVSGGSRIIFLIVQPSGLLSVIAGSTRVILIQSGVFRRLCGCVSVGTGVVTF